MTKEMLHRIADEIFTQLQSLTEEEKCDVMATVEHRLWLKEQREIEDATY